MTTATATPRQLEFLKTLTAERVTEPHQNTILSEVVSGTRILTKAEASLYIGTLLTAPRKPKAAPSSPTYLHADALSQAFGMVEVGKYAVPASGIQIPGVVLTGDLLFLEVRAYKGHKYLNRLHGSVGSFRRSRFTVAATVALLHVIAGRHIEYGRAFGEHFTCCGRCASPLTDQRSRETHFGPECRRIYGIV